MRELILDDGRRLPLPRVHPGPRGGDGRGRGRPFNGIVEDTTCVWVGWFRALARGYGLSMEQLSDAVEANGKPLRFVSRRLTYGERWFFVCPRCGRRCEALYLLRGELACRICHHLGYASQCHRPTSPEATWEELLRPLSRRLRRYFVGTPMRSAFEGLLRWQAERGIRRILESLSFAE